MIKDSFLIHMRDIQSGSKVGFGLWLTDWPHAETYFWSTFTFIENFEYFRVSDLDEHCDH